MLNFFKKKEAENLDTPKNLPELAKDIFESPPSDSAQKKASTVQEIPAQAPPAYHKVPNVPVSSGVPRLDLDLIRSSNIHLPPSDVPHREEPAIQKPINIIPEPANIPVNMAVPQGDMRENILRGRRNIYIAKNKALFEDLESAIVNKKDDLAKEIISNILPLLYEYHDVDSMDDSDRIKELKDLEKFWAMLQKRNYAMKYLIDSVEADILRKSSMLLNADDSRKYVQMHSSLNSPLNSPSNLSIALPVANQPSMFQPVFVPVVKNPPASNVVTPIYVSPNERFYFKDGKIASSLKDLYYMIGDISDDTFYHHVSLERNDFANWVKDVLKEYLLAKDISNIYSRRELLEFLKDKI